MLQYPSALSLTRGRRFVAVESIAVTVVSSSPLPSSPLTNLTIFRLPNEIPYRRVLQRPSTSPHGADASSQSVQKSTS
jgi:hypothetical protein